MPLVLPEYHSLSVSMKTVKSMNKGTRINAIPKILRERKLIKLQ
jgi:hypothetical protein